MLFRGRRSIPPERRGRRLGMGRPSGSSESTNQLKDESAENLMSDTGTIEKDTGATVRAASSVDGLAGHYDHRVKPGNVKIELDDSYLGDRANRAREKAHSAGRLDENEVFIGRRGNSSNIIADMESFKDYKDYLEDIRKDLKDTTRFDRDVARRKTDLERKAKKVLGDLDESLHRHDQAINTLKEEETRAWEKLEKAYQKKAESLSRTKVSTPVEMAQLAEQNRNLRDWHETAVQAHRDKFDEAIREHVEFKDKINNVVEDITKETGLNAAEHMRKTMGTGTSKAVSVAEKAIEKEAGMFGRIGRNFKAGGMRATGAAVGSIIGIGAGISGLSDLAVAGGMKSPGVDEQGKEKSTDGKLFTGIAKLAAAAASVVFLAARGGAKGLHR